MKLTYRGVDYDYNPPVLDVTESEVACQYRGQVATYTYVRHVPIPQPAEQLTYRGVAYQTTRQGQILQLDNSHTAAQATNAGHAGINFANLRSKLMGASPAAAARRQLVQESSLLHRDNIARSLQHRLDVAKANGNDLLVQQLETERVQSV